MIEKCALCAGTIKKTRISVDLRVKGRLYVFENVPALVCQKCGEIILAPRITMKIEKLLLDKSTLHKTIRVPVYDLKETKP